MRPLPSIAAKLVPEYRPGVTIAIAVAPVLAPPGKTFPTAESQDSAPMESGGECPTPIPAYQVSIGVERGKLGRNREFSTYSSQKWGKPTSHRDHTTDTPRAKGKSGNKKANTASVQASPTNNGQPE